MIDPSGIKYGLSEKQQAIAAGGIGSVMQVVNQVGLRDEINRATPLLKLHLP